MRTVAALLLIALVATTPAAAQTAPISLEPLARIGCSDCAGPEMFAGVQALAIAGDWIYVADRTAPFVRVFDSRGRLRRAFATAGDGPGELRLPILLAPRPGGDLEVYDMRQQRFTRFDSTGAAKHTRSARAFIVAAASIPGRAEALLATSDFRSAEQPLLRLADDADAPVRIAVLDATFPRIAASEPPRTPSLAAAPDGGFAVGDGTAEYRIRRFDADVHHTTDIVRDVPRVRKSPAEIEQEREQVRARMGAVQRMARAENTRATPTPYEPARDRNHFNLDALRFDQTGRLWVRTERAGPAATIFDIFDPAGRFLGELRVDTRIRTFAIHDGILAGLTADDDGVEFIRIWRVR